MDYSKLSDDEINKKDNMKAIIELSGVITNSSIYFSAPTTIAASNSWCYEKVKNLGFDLFVNCENSQMEGYVIYTNHSKNENAEVLIITQDITAIIKPICNVEVKIVREYSFFQWIGFYVLSLYRWMNEDK